jgi:hypothetical protein
MGNLSRIVRVFYNYVLPLAVAAFVALFCYQQLSKLKDRPVVSFRIEWLIPAGLLYLLAHTVWASFWVSLLHNQKVNVSWSRGVRSYFISQFGKYVPGKVLVILIRIRMLGVQGISKSAIGVTATFETLTSMGAGALLGMLLLPLMALDHTGLGWKIYLLIPLSFMPLAVWGLNRMVSRIAKKRQPAGSPPWPEVGIFTLIRGLFQASVGWCILGLSFWMTVEGLSPNATQWTWEYLGRLTAINCIAYVAGFLALFMPAGAGVRETLLAVLLAFEFEPIMGDSGTGLAVVVAVVLRLLWTTFELICAGLLYALIPAQQRAAVPDPNCTSVPV